MNRNFSPLFFLLLVVSMVACGEKTKAPPAGQKRSAAKVDGFIVKTESFAENIETPGTIVANEVTEIHPEVSGRVVQLHIREGQWVARGTVLAKIYDGDLQAQLKKLETQQKIAKVNEDRARQLVDIQGISKQDYDASLLTLQNIQADIALVQTEISRTVVRAPFDGKIGLKAISPGAYVTPLTIIATINQTSTIKIDFVVPEKYTAQIHPGQVVDFTVEGTNTTYTAKVTATESNVAVTNRSLTVRGVVTGTTQGLIPGAFAKVKIGFAPKSNALFIPTQSILPTARGKQVILVNNSKAIFTDVQTGSRDSARVEITNGLKTGDTILVTGVMATKPNSQVSINKIIN
ncbi:efflux RND transporter periplasmic adaptor subunit [Niabella beijingensis]|uniref:efflux RND transporter periplasmic adaptor subunit n=1 Tax=Niabella beijingensis TaxID=2872700 RepID=UPI001CC17913|nr:efflux RND transporter periplasmic adaptor subunit [Niabella beijingensis]MBZ4187313.1 efflux RND transporter periplasmic adaptor subunit [Niabella beijingensis]